MTENGKEREPLRHDGTDVGEAPHAKPPVVQATLVPPEATLVPPDRAKRRHRQGEVEALRQVARAAREVIISIPATTDPDDPMVRQHARALNALGDVIRALDEAS